VGVRHGGRGAAAGMGKLAVKQVADIIAAACQYVGEHPEVVNTATVATTATATAGCNLA
jgi:hypothetical protein